MTGERQGVGKQGKEPWNRVQLLLGTQEEICKAEFGSFQ